MKCCLKTKNCCLKTQTKHSLNLLIFKFCGKPFFFFFLLFILNIFLGCFIYLFILTLDLCHLSLWPSNLHLPFFFFFGYDLGHLLLFAPLKKPLYIFCNQTKPILLILIDYYLLS